MKRLAIAAILAAAYTPAFANQNVSDVRVFHHTVDVLTEVVTEGYKCDMVDVPIYSEGEANPGDFLVGAIIGGLLGGTVTDSDKGAAVGAFTGGVIAAEKGKKKVVGYRQKEICNKQNIVKQTTKPIYSHSTIRFYMDGKRYVLRFEK